MQPPFHIEKKYALCRCNFSYVQRKLYIWNSVFHISSTWFCSLLLHDNNSISPGWTLPNRRMVPATWPIKCSELKLPRIIEAIHLSIVLHLVIPSILLSFLGCIHQHYCFISSFRISFHFFNKRFPRIFFPQSHNTRSGMRRNNYVINDSIFNTNISFSKPRSVQLYEKRNTIN